MIDIIELVRIARCIHTGRMPRLGDVAAVIRPKGANATSSVIEAFRNRYHNHRTSVQEVVRLSNWAQLPIAAFTCPPVDAKLKLTYYGDNEDTARGSALGDN